MKISFTDLSEEQRQSTAAKLFSRVHVQSDGCVEYRKSQNSNGYGRVYVDDKLCRANRVSWILRHGPIPTGLLVLHRCDNPLCVNPDHLFLGTQSDNMEDAIAKGRRPRMPRIMKCGEESNFAKFSNELIDRVRKDCVNRTESYASIGKRYGMSWGHVRTIALGKQRVLPS